MLPKEEKRSAIDGGKPSTFDISLWINNNERAAVRERYHLGDEVTYVGRFDSYDDIWRTFYLVNGAVVGYSQADLGF